MSGKLSLKERLLLVGALAFVLFILGSIVWSIRLQDGRQKLPQFDLLRFDCGTYEYLSDYTHSVENKNLPWPISEHDLGTKIGTVAEENLYAAEPEWLDRAIWQLSGCDDGSVLIAETDDGYQYLFKTLD